MSLEGLTEAFLHVSQALILHCKAEIGMEDTTRIGGSQPKEKVRNSLFFSFLTGWDGISILEDDEHISHGKYEMDDESRRCRWDNGGKVFKKKNKTKSGDVRLS